MGFLCHALFLSTLILHARCFPNGVGIDSACSNLTPRHGIPSQTSPPPYTVTFNPTSYTPGQTVAVTITSSSVGFKGIMIQARRADANQNQELLGSFSGDSASTRPACTGKALVHTNNDPKSSLTFNWIAPSVSVRDIVFRVTFVQREDLFWANTVSGVLVEAIPPTAPAPRPTTARPTAAHPPQIAITHPPTKTVTVNDQSTPSTENEIEPGCTRYCRGGFSIDCTSCCWDMVVERYGNLQVNSMNSRDFRARQIFLNGQLIQCMREFMNASLFRL